MSEAQLNPSLDDLLGDMMHPNPRIQEEASIAMAENYPEDAIPKLLELFCHADPKIYRAAVKGIGFFGYSAFLPLLELYSTTDNQTARRCCPKAFVQLFKNFPNQPFPDEVINMLDQGIDDPDAVVVQGALMCLGQIGKQDLKADEAINILNRALVSENVALVYSASQALADIPNPKAKDALLSLLNKAEEPLLKEAAESAIARFDNLMGS
jgi:bilin biosynthesis protein